METTSLTRPALAKMNILTAIACAFLVWLLAGTATVWAQSLPPVDAGPKKIHPKLPSVLQELVDKYSRDPVIGRLFMRQRLLREHALGDAVRLILWPKDLRSASIPRGDLRAWNVLVEAESPSLLQVLAPITSIVSLADQLPGVRSVSLPDIPKPLDSAPYPAQPSTISEGVAKTGANTYHAVGITGNGIKVAIIDLGFQNIQSAISAGEFGSPHKIDPACTKNYITGATGISAVDHPGSGGSHGVSVAHDVHNMAPGATLCLKLINTLVDLENATNDAMAQGVKIINHSVAWALGSFYDGTALVDTIAAGAVDHGILWVNAAGNDALNHWQGPWADPDADRWLNFAGDDECNDVTLTAGVPYRFMMNWDAYPSDPQDYDLYLFRINPEKTVTVVAGSTGAQSGTQLPEEVIFYVPPATGTYCFAFWRHSAPIAPQIEIFIWDGSPQYNAPQSSLMNPMSDPKVMAVAAIRHDYWTAGPQEAFSSQGPTNSSKFASARVEPAVSAPDGTIDFDGEKAFGTSFAAPHVAGCAALIKAANPGFTASQIRSQLESDAIDMGVAGKDNLFGWGRLNCSLQGTPADDDPPLPPQSLRVSPSGWTNVNAFRVDWDNPIDASGIVAAWYKIGSSHPTAPHDGTRTTDKPFTAISPSEGEQQIHLWLEDGAGNVTHEPHSMATLRYDGTAPTASIAINNGAENTSSLVVALNISATDTGGSGVTAMRFSNDNSTWTAWEPYGTTKSNWNLSVLGGNTKTVHAQLRDGAGNVSPAASDSILFAPVAAELELTGHFTRLQMNCRGGRVPLYQVATTLTIENLGTLPISRTFQVKYYLSQDNVPDESDVFLASINVTASVRRPIRVGGANRVSRTFRFTSCPQGKHLIAHLDAADVIPEQNETNNAVVGGPLGVAAAGTSTLPLPLHVTRISAYSHADRGSNSILFFAHGTGIAGIEVVVFDLRGHKVWESGAEGTQVVWDSAENRSAHVATGVYLYVVTLRGFNDDVYTSEVRKLVLLRRTGRTRI